MKTLEETEIPEDLVFSHGSLTLQNILANGSGLTGIINFQKAGVADRYRDLASIAKSLEEVSMEPDELFKTLGLNIDRAKLEYHKKLIELY